MGEYFDQIPDPVKSHVKDITKDIQTAGEEDIVERVAKGWLDKKEAFGEKLIEFDMEEVECLGQNDEDGALVLTYSGSLVNIGPLVEGVRNVSYSSIGFRTNTPDAAENDQSKLAGDVKVDEIVEFSPGPVKSTSKVYKIAVCRGDLTAEEQAENLDEAVTVIEEEFIEVNKTVMME